MCKMDQEHDDNGVFVFVKWLIIAAGAVVAYVRLTSAMCTLHSDSLAFHSAQNFFFFFFCLDIRTANELYSLVYSTCYRANKKKIVVHDYDIYEQQVL